MSKASHDKFLVKLHDEMQRSSQTYRTTVSDKKRHVFTYRAKDIRAALKTLLDLEENSKKKRDGSTFQKEYGKLVTKLTTDLRRDFHKIAGEVFNQVIADDIRGGVVVIAYEMKESRRSNYELVKGVYLEHLTEFYQAFSKLLKKPLTRPTGKGKKKTTKTLTEVGDVFNLGHKEGGSNIEHLMNDSVHSALETAYGSSELTPEAKRAIIDKLGEEDAASIFKVYQDADDGVIYVSLEGAWGNYTKGGKDEQQLNRDLKSVLEKLDIEELRGSDSLIEGHRKKLIKALIQPYFKQKNVVKIKYENTKPSGTSETKFEHKPKVTAGSGARKMAAKKTIAAQKAAKQTVPNLASILGFLNMKLPDVVAGNMGDPRLNYRTGRFSQSVRATDVSQTAQGFPSIGYTYDKANYGQFENTSGTRFADIDRDPRPLIDSSIREIVMQLGMGRIYTRRQ